VGAARACTAELGRRLVTPGIGTHVVSRPVRGERARCGQPACRNWPADAPQVGHRRYIRRRKHVIGTSERCFCRQMHVIGHARGTVGGQLSPRRGSRSPRRPRPHPLIDLHTGCWPDAGRATPAPSPHPDPPPNGGGRPYSPAIPRWGRENPCGGKEASPAGGPGPPGRATRSGESPGRRGARTGGAGGSGPAGPRHGSRTAGRSRGSP
jgi:hypothetical protein